jgi:predicted dehydrogenase
MKNMLRQPAWHRGLRELQANWQIHTASLRQKELKQTPEGENIYRIGFIGCGRVMRRHALGYINNGRCLLVAASDPSEKQRLKAKKRFHINSLYADFNQMLQAEKLDIVSICAPPRFHAPAVIACAQAKMKAILCEKPLALDLQEADQMIEICKQNQSLLATGHQRRFGEQHIMAKKILQEGRLGEIHHIVADCPRDILRAGIHCADMLLDYFGPIYSVVASLSDGKGGPAKGVQEACLSAQAGDKDSLIHVQFQNGYQATLRVEDRGGLDAQLTILGSQGLMEIWWDGGMRYRRNQDTQWQIPNLKLNPYLLEFQKSQEAIIEVLDNHGDGSQLPIRGEDGRNSLEVILAILISNQENRQVSLPLPSGENSTYPVEQSQTKQQIG